MNFYNIDSVARTAREWADEAKAAEMITSDFIPVNMWMVRFIGLDATLFLSAAYEELLYLRGRKKSVTNDSIVFSTRKAQQKTGLGSDRQKNAIIKLKSFHLIDCRIENGIPKKRIISFNFSYFRSFVPELNEYVQRELETIKIERYKFNSKMDHIRDAAREAHYQEQKISWEKQNPGKSYEEYINDLPY